MSYSVDKLASVAECDAVLAQITEKKNALTYKKGLLLHRQDLVSKSAVSIANDLTTLNSRIASCESLAQTITDPEALRENARDLENYNHRKFQLLDKLQDSGSIALLDIETDLGLISVQEAELATAEAAVTARKAAL